MVRTPITQIAHGARNGSRWGSKWVAGGVATGVATAPAALLRVGSAERSDPYAVGVLVRTPPALRRGGLVTSRAPRIAPWHP